ncbi:MAG: TVP38/TMEM64 family protein [Rubrobacter sp.]
MPLEAARYLLDSMATGAAGALIYVAFYALSRLVFFPPTLLTIASGFVFGPVWGVVLAVLGSNAAAVFSYLMARYFGQGLLGPGETTGTLGRYAERMRENGFESVLLLRLVYAPFDPVSILAGFLRIDWRRFVLATLLGSLPCILSLVLFGASLERDFVSSGFRLNPWILLASAILFTGSLLFSRSLKRRSIVYRGTD